MGREAYGLAMDTKPSYLGLLNAIAMGERNGAELFSCWSSVTTNPDVGAVLHTVALREAEHAVAFEKRIDELGFGVVPRTDPQHEAKMTIAASTTLSDRQKLEQLKLIRLPNGTGGDVFDTMFENKDLDPVTGGLLGRYIAEERDTGRLLTGCHGALCVAEGTPVAAASPSMEELAQQVADAGRHLADLVRCIGATLAPAAAR